MCFPKSSISYKVNFEKTHKHTKNQKLPAQVVSSLYSQIFYVFP